MTEMTTPACCEETVRIPLIGEKAPSFEAVTTQGKISFPDDYKGKWVILFSHPADFTPVYTTEFMTFASMQEEFRELNCELIGLSIDSNFSHIAWLRTIKEKIKFRDGGYAAFGKVVSGYEEAERIASVPCDRNDKPLSPQRMKKVTVELFGVEYPEPEILAD
jgi:peroxiredoxin